MMMRFLLSILGRLLLLAAVVSVFFGCATGSPIPLSPVNHQLSEFSVGPALSLPEAGLHRYSSLSYSRGESDGVKWQNGATQFGLLNQPSLVPDWTGGLFERGDIGVSGSSVSIGGNSTGSAGLGSESFNPWSGSAEANLAIGGIAKFYIGTLQVYGVGILQYEFGQYFDKRKDLDGVNNYYNLAKAPFSAGYGLGCDLAFGSYRGFDVGATFEILSFLNRTQSLSGATEKYLGKDSLGFEKYAYDISTTAGGVMSATDSIRVGTYIDILELRLSLEESLVFLGQFGSQNVGSVISTGLAYRW
jgi:hypothetical protein